MRVPTLVLCFAIVFAQAAAKQSLRDADDEKVQDLTADEGGALSSSFYNQRQPCSPRQVQLPGGGVININCGNNQPPYCNPGTPGCNWNGNCVPGSQGCIWNGNTWWNGNGNNWNGGPNIWNGPPNNWNPPPNNWNPPPNNWNPPPNNWNHGYAAKNPHAEPQNVLRSHQRHQHDQNIQDELARYGRRYKKPARSLSLLLKRLSD